MLIQIKIFLNIAGGSRGICSATHDYRQQLDMMLLKLCSFQEILKRKLKSAA